MFALHRTQLVAWATKKLHGKKKATESHIKKVILLISKRKMPHETPVHMPHTFNTQQNHQSGILKFYNFHSCTCFWSPGVETCTKSVCNTCSMIISLYHLEFLISQWVTFFSDVDSWLYTIIACIILSLMLQYLKVFTWSFPPETEVCRFEL